VFHRAGGDIHVLATEASGKPALENATFHLGNLAGFLETLAGDFGVKHLHCEGGGMVVRELAEIDAIDEFHLTLAGHTLFGGLEAPTSTGLPDGFLAESRGFSLQRFDPRPESGECFLSYLRQGSRGPAQ
jgi:riboflavin biosynthesis pyrimidine reductase